MSPEETKAFIRQWVEDVWNNHRYDRIQTAIAPNYVMRSPGVPDIHGPEGFRQFIGMYHGALSDFHMVIEDVVVEADAAAWRISTRATHTGTLFGVPASGRTMTTPAVIISRFKDGQWVEDWVQLDVLGMLQAMGAIPAPAEATA